MPTVIKASEQNPTFVKKCEAIDISDHLAEAKLVLKAAREKARTVLARTRAEADVIRQDAAGKGHDEGFRRGYEAGTSAGYQAAFDEAHATFSKDQANLVGAMSEMIDAFERMKRDLFISARQDVLRFAGRVAERITKQVGLVDRHVATANLEAALRLVESKTDLVARVSAADRATLERFAQKLAEQTERTRNISVQVDDSVAPGGCRLVGKDVEIDATLETQIEQIAQLVVGDRESSE
jgi:flagellar biosynthesis/type III secretory pathway protein FliH